MGKAADEALELARERIVQAKQEGWEKLDFHSPKFEALEKLPEELADLTALRSLNLRQTKVNNLSPLSGLTGLHVLNIEETRVSDISVLRSLAALEFLSVAGTKVGDLAPLSGLKDLTTLVLGATQVNDLWPLANLEELSVLDLTNTPVADLSPLAGLRRLRVLDLQSTQVTDVSALSGITSLSILRLWNTMVADVSALAGLTGLTELFLWNTRVSDLSKLDGLTALKSLYLANTPVSDLSALKGMSQLQFLDIRGTEVDRDQLSVLRGNSGLIEDSFNATGDRRGVHFADSSATRSDQELARIARIENDRERTLALFEYLGVEVAKVPPEPDPLLSTVIENSKLEIPAVFPSPDEQEERLKQAMHERLRPKAAECAQKAGNTFPRMAGKARVLATLLDRPFAELDLLSVHLEIEDIEARAKAGTEDGEPYDADLLLAVGEVTRLGPGLTRGNADVELYEQRFKQTRERADVASVEGPRTALSEAILASPDAHGPRSLALEERMKDAADPDMARTLRDPKQRNLLWRLGSVAALAVGGVASNVAANVIAGAYGTEITAFVVKNWGLLMEVAATYGVGFASWIAGTVGLLMIGKGVKEERDKRTRRDEDDGAL